MLCTVRLYSSVIGNKRFTFYYINFKLRREKHEISQCSKRREKIFNAEIISLIAALIGGAGLILGLIGASNETDESAGTTLLAVSGALLIVSGIALLVAGIMNIIGFIQAAKDEEGIKRAVLCTVFSALFAFVAAFFENQTGFLGGLGTVLSSIATVLNMLVALFMIGAVYRIHL